MNKHTTHSIDEYEYEYKFNFSSKQIFNTIINFNNYHKWWPKLILFQNIETTEKIIGSKIFVKPCLATGFHWKITNFVNNSMVEIKYFQGAYNGTGIWKIIPCENHLTLSYEVNLTITDKFTKVLSYFVRINLIHSKMMNQVFIKLEKYLNSK